MTRKAGRTGTHLVDVDGQGGAVGEPVSAGSAHVCVPRLTASGQQSHLPHPGHVGLEKQIRRDISCFHYDINVLFIVLDLTASSLIFMP